VVNHAVSARGSTRKRHRDEGDGSEKLFLVSHLHLTPLKSMIGLANILDVTSRCEGA